MRWDCLSGRSRYHITFPRELPVKTSCKVTVLSKPLTNAVKYMHITSRITPITARSKFAQSVLYRDGNNTERALPAVPSSRIYST